MSFGLGSAFVQIGSNLSGFNSGISKARGGLTAFSNFASVTMAQIAAQAIMSFAKMAVQIPIALAKMGSDVQENTNFFNVVLGDNAKEVGEWADAYADAANRSAGATRKMAAEYVDLLVPLGMSKEGSIDLSKGLTRLTNDLASFKNKNPDEVMNDLQAALTGSGEVMKKYGVIVSETTLKSEALAQGLDPKNITEVQKAMLRYNIILKGTTAAQDDALNTSDQFANTLRGIQGRFMDLAGIVGTGLLTGFQRVLDLGLGFVKMLNQNSGAITGVAEAIGNYIGTAAETVFPNLLRYWGALIEIGKNFMPVIEAAGSALIWALDGWGKGAAGVAEYIAQLTGAIMDFGIRGSNSVKVLGDTFGATFSFIGSTTNSVFGTLFQWLGDIGFMFLNLDLSIKTMGTILAETFDNAILRITNFVTNGGVLFKWFGDNFGDIIKTSVDYVLTVLENLGKNIRALWSGVLDFIAGRGFNVDFSGLTDGFKNTVSKMPEFEAFKSADYTDAFDELDKEWENRAAEWDKTFKDNAVSMGSTYQNEIKKVDFGEMKTFDTSALKVEGGDKNKSSTKSSAGSTLGLSAAFDQIQKAALGDKDNIPKQSLETEKNMLAEQKKTNEILAKRATGAAVAVYA